MDRLDLDVKEAPLGNAPQVIIDLNEVSGTEAFDGPQDQACHRVRDQRSGRERDNDRGCDTDELDDRLVGRDRVGQPEQRGDGRRGGQEDYRELAGELRYAGLTFHDAVDEPEHEHGDHTEREWDVPPQSRKIDSARLSRSGGRMQAGCSGRWRSLRPSGSLLGFTLLGDAS